MATPLVTKIVLKNTTKMSLNERFTAYRTQVTALAARNKIQRQSTSANLRLAQQMANRPTVMAALRLKKRSLQQRLGGGRQQQRAAAAVNSVSIKSRLSLNNNRAPHNSSNLQGRLGTFRSNNRGAVNRIGRRGGGFRAGTSPLVKARLGGNFGQQQGNFRSNRRGNFRVGNQPNRRNTNQGGNRLPPSRNARGGGRGRGNRGGAWGRRGAATNVVAPTKQELDNQLDEYMAETKGSLDAQLGDYMKQG